ncbi:MAG: putative O-glycosylation ligase, exosortase A system-associated [Acidobacteria bacterium]|nr:putative O-glycosylation ligase, exosortase A system-associated [Acidobacteriota bacterium]
MRQLLIFSIIFLLIPLAFFAPFTGLMSYVWIAYVRPHEWAYMPTTQLSLAVAGSTLIGYLIFELTKRSPKLIPNGLILLLWLQLALAAFLSEFPATAQAKLIEFSKTLLIALLITAMVDSEKRFRWLILCTVFSIGFLAFRSNLGILLTLGQTRIYGPGGAFEDNNDYALLLNVAAPLAFYAGRGESQIWLKRSCYVLSAMMMITVIFTLSRGGFLGLCVVALCIALKSRHKLSGIAAVIVLGLLLLFVLPARVVERVGTIRNASEADESAQMRLATWRVCLSIIADHPVFGVGPRSMLEAYSRYSDTTAVRVAHNSFLQMAVDAGLPALIIFLSIIVLSFYRLRRARSDLRSRAPDSKLIAYSHGLEIALIGYVVSANFLSRNDLELFYEIAALSTSFHLIARELVQMKRV